MQDQLFMWQSKAIFKTSAILFINFFHVKICFYDWGNFHVEISLLILWKYVWEHETISTFKQ